MRHEKTFIRPDGSKVKITASLDADNISNCDCAYSFAVQTCEPRKRTWKSVTSTEDYEWRKLDWAGRMVKDIETKLKFVTQAEVQETMLELWEKAKPDFSYTP
jgi:hypothetical protein